jgi:hypothetical protein
VVVVVVVVVVFRSNVFALSSNTGQPGADFDSMTIFAKGQRTGPRAKLSITLILHRSTLLDCEVESVTTHDFLDRTSGTGSMKRQSVYDCFHRHTVLHASTSAIIK